MTWKSLGTLPEGLAEIVARHLVAANRAIVEDPELALAHARAASRRAARVAVVREAVGVAAYAAGEYATALNELRAAARISGSSEYLPMMADCERALGRPERVLDLASSPEATTLDRAGKAEMLIVAAGARRDLGQLDAAILTLQVPALKARTADEWLARLRYAYADALAAAGRLAEAREWFIRAAEVDPEGTTDAVERVDELDGITFDDVDDAGAPEGTPESHDVGAGMPERTGDPGNSGDEPAERPAADGELRDEPADRPASGAGEVEAEDVDE